MKLSRGLRLVALSLSISSSSAQVLVDGKGLFSYNPYADNGPPLWPTLDTSPDENVCGGHRQSPIALTASQPCGIYNAEYELEGSTCTTDQLNYFNNDHSVEFEYPEEGCNANTMSMPGIDGVYELLQCHIHTGSEHTYEGFTADFELHCVHKLVEGSGTGEGEVAGTGLTITNTQAVMGMFMLVKEQEDNAAFQPLLDGWQAYQDNVLAGCDVGTNSTRRRMTSRSLQEFNVYSLVDPTSFYFYSGSLTTPPCTEDLWWNVATDPITLSVKQGEQLSELILDYRDENCEPATGANPRNGFTSRPTQDISGRTVSLYCLGDAPPDQTTNSASKQSSASVIVSTVVVGAVSFL